MSKLFDRWVKWMKRRGSYRLIKLHPDGREGIEEKVPYLERFFIFRLPGRGGLFLHKFHMSDPEEPHDHPWNSGGIVLSGLYWEKSLDGRVHERNAGYIRWCRSAGELHRVILPPTYKPWTLFWHGKRIREWGWLEGAKWVRSPDNDIVQKAPMKGWVFPYVDNLKVEA